MGHRGSEIETPAIDRLAREGVRLERFYATPICSPTRAALMTGRDPLELGIAYDQIHPWYNAGLPPDAYTIADAFRAAGYQTAAVVANPNVAAEFGFDRGFDHYDDEMGVRDRSARFEAERTADRVVDAYLTETRLLQEAGERDAALAVYETALSAHPDDAELLCGGPLTGFDSRLQLSV